MTKPAEATGFDANCDVWYTERGMPFLKCDMGLTRIESS